MTVQICECQSQSRYTAYYFEVKNVREGKGKGERVGGRRKREEKGGRKAGKYYYPILQERKFTKKRLSKVK